MPAPINPEDIVHKTFNRLYVDSYIGKEKGFHLYKCTCKCGNITTVRRDGLLTGKTGSCGCYNRDLLSSINPDDILHKTIGRVYTINWYKKNGDYYYHCKCSCGNYIDIRRDGLLTNKCPSCGCYMREISHLKSITHDLTRDHKDFYNSYVHMIHRCLNPNDTSYINYGARGIFVCKEWIGTPGYETTSTWFGLDGLLNFKNDMFESFLEFKNTHSSIQIDRRNNNDGYYKENCRWVTSEINANNRRANIYLEYNGEILSFANLYKKYGDKRININTVYNRIFLLGWNIHDALYIHTHDNLRSPIHFFNPDIHQ